MKVYEIAVNEKDKDDDGDILIWIATDGTVKPGVVSSVKYCKVIKVDPHAPGIDLIITTKK